MQEVRLRDASGQGGESGVPHLHRHARHHHGGPRDFISGAPSRGVQERIRAQLGLGAYSLGPGWLRILYAPSTKQAALFCKGVSGGLGNTCLKILVSEEAPSLVQLVVVSIDQKPLHVSCVDTRIVRFGTSTVQLRGCASLLGIWNVCMYSASCREHARAVYELHVSKVHPPRRTDGVPPRSLAASRAA